MCGRTVEERLREHIRHFKHKNVERSAVAQHAWETGHDLLFEDTRVLAREDRWWPRRLKESMEIAKPPEHQRRRGIAPPRCLAAFATGHRSVSCRTGPLHAVRSRTAPCGPTADRPVPSKHLRSSRWRPAPLRERFRRSLEFCGGGLRVLWPPYGCPMSGRRTWVLTGTFYHLR